MSFFILILIVIVSLSMGYHLPKLPVMRKCSTNLHGFNFFDHSFLSAVQEVVTRPADYKYGAVDAPGWALPLGAFFAILIAGVPILLGSGEKVNL